MLLADDSPGAKKPKLYTFDTPDDSFREISQPLAASASNATASIKTQAPSLRPPVQARAIVRPKNFSILNIDPFFHRNGLWDNESHSNTNMNSAASTPLLLGQTPAPTASAHVANGAMIPTTTLMTTLTPPTDTTTIAMSVFTIAPPTSSLAAASTLTTTPTPVPMPMPMPTSASTPTSTSMPAIILVPMIALAPTPTSAPAATVMAMPLTLQTPATMQASTMVPTPPSRSPPATIPVPSTVTPTLTSTPMLATLASVSLIVIWKTTPLY